MATLSIAQATNSTDGYLSSVDWNTFNNKVSTVFGRSGNILAQAGDYENFYQPLDADLTAIAALTTTTYGRSLLTQSDAAATQAALGLGTIANSNTEDFTASATFTSHTSAAGNGSHIPSTGITNTHVATNAAIDVSKLSGVATSTALTNHISATDTRLNALESSTAITTVRAYGLWNNLVCGNNVTDGTITGTGGNEVAASSWTQNGGVTSSNTIVSVPVPSGLSYWRLTFRAQFNTTAGAGSRPTRVELIPSISLDGSNFTSAVPPAGVWGSTEAVVVYLNGSHVVIVNAVSSGFRWFRLRQTNNATGGTFSVFGATLFVERIG